jgi:PIN domain nuclease of toxin-antitoxin system
LRLLLDTHALIWWVEDSPRLSEAARAAIAGNEVLVSAASAWEVTTKFRLGKLPSAERMARAFAAEVAAEGFNPLPVTLDHAALAGTLDIPHKDPFDRLLIAQARIERLPLASNETLFDGFGVERIW